VNRAALRFWGSAAAVSIAFAALAPVLFPFRAIGLDPAVDRERIWLLVVFTASMMLVLFGLSAWLGGRRAVGMRDVVEARGALRAMERVRDRGDESGTDRDYTRNAAAWCIVTGALLLVIYFALFAALG
jgi:hypothetical protein